ncbi:MAG: cupredoxin domain-containing protein [Fimbriiglobus sp.]
MFQHRFFAFVGLVTTTLVLISSTQADETKYVTVKGQVKRKELPQAEFVDVNADKAHCEMNGKLPKEAVLVDKTTKGLKNVVVWIRPDTDDRKETFPKDKIKPELAKPTPKTHTIDQPCCQFIPRILAVRVGDDLEVKNSSPVAHNIKIDEFGINPIMAAKSTYKATKPFAATNSPIKFTCSIHSWMVGNIRVFDHPYYAITDKDGKFEIKDLPAGKWRIVYWHENGLHQGKTGALGFPFEAKDAMTELKAIDFEFPKQ